MIVQKVIINSTMELVKDTILLNICFPDFRPIPEDGEEPETEPDTGEVVQGESWTM